MKAPDAAPKCLCLTPIVRALTEAVTEKAKAEARLDQIRRALEEGANQRDQISRIRIVFRHIDRPAIGP